MSHTALARKYRPNRFADLVGQEHVATGLAGAVERNLVAHGYLLTGPRGVGKTTAARILAMALNCETDARDSGEPCGTCDSCTRIWAGHANLDVVEIDAASNRGVDDARDLRERAMYAASGPDRFKVYIVDEAHMLTREAWNALLKILEEPPPRVVFVFATTEPQKIANTSAAVISRLQRFDFRNIGPASIVARLRFVAEAEGIDIDDDALVLLARVANGGMRDGLSMLDQTLVFGDGQVTAERVREALGLIGDEAYAELLDIIADGRSAEVFPFIERVVDQGADLGEFINGMAEVLRSLMLVKVGGEPQGLTTSARAAIEGVADRFEAGDVLRMLRLLADTEGNLRLSPNPRLHAEALILQWTLLDRTVDLQAVLAGLGGAPGPVGAATRSGSPPAGAATRPTKNRTSSPPAEAPRAPATRADPGPENETAPGPSAPEDLEPAPFGTIEEAQAVWPAVLDAVGLERRMLREVLNGVTPVGLVDNQLSVSLADEGVLGAVERGRRTLEAVLAKVASRPIRVEFLSGQEAAHGGRNAPPRPSESRRQTPDGDRKERLGVYRAQDESLDAMVDALDLELQE